MINRYLITENNGDNNHAGSKARNDVEDILFNNGYKKLEVKKYKKSEGLKNKINIILNLTIDWIKIFITIERKSTVIVQYPLESPKKLVNFYLNKVKLVKNIRFVAIIHDLESLRFSRKSDKSEIKFLNEYSSIICHNEKMKEYLIKNGINEKKLISLEVFDYLFKDSDKLLSRNNNNEIVIAGNLSEEKSPYVYLLNHIPEGVKFNLFGPNFKQYDSKNIEYIGQYPPEKLPYILKGNYGLVWDGNSINTCDGITGNYLKYNNPHKISLYIVSKLPVIVWKKSAMASFVEREQIGFTVSSLTEIGDIIKSISNDEYNKMINNLERLSKKLNDGYYLNNAIEKIEL